MDKKKLILGTRGSNLALIYANRTKDLLSNFLNFDIIIKKISTKGDEIQNKRLSEIGGKGLFSKSIELELIEKKIDLAVHALKDMPSIETNGLITDCYLKRNFSNEILISRNNTKFENLKKNSIIGTSSLRREYQLKKKRSDLNYRSIRGNVDTRIKKLKDGFYDAIILAKAGICSLNLEKEITQEFSNEEMMPSVGQGIVAIQCREEDKEIFPILSKINDDETKISAIAERQVLKSLEGDCDTAIGVMSTINHDKITLAAELFSLDGKKRYFTKSSKEKKFAKQLGEEIGIILKKESNYSYRK